MGGRGGGVGKGMKIYGPEVFTEEKEKSVEDQP